MRVGGAGVSAEPPVSRPTRESHDPLLREIHPNVDERALNKLLTKKI
jgi:hypothetical protein